MDGFSAWLGFMAGFLGCILLTLATGVSGNADWVTRYDGVKELVADLRDDCEAQRGVVECEWVGDGFQPKGGK